MAAILALGAMAVGTGALAHGDEDRYERRGDARGQGMHGYGMHRYGGGPGMMGDEYGGPGMMQGYGRGPGMMGGYGMGPGMMGGYGMGPGMMGGHGMGPGMMGGHGMGPGMMGGMGPYAAGVLGLGEEQRERIDDIQRDHAREHWQLMQEMRERHREMLELYREGEVDPAEVGRAYEGMAAAQRRMLEQRARMHNQVREVLTEEQRERLEEMRRYRYPGYE